MTDKFAGLDINGWHDRAVRNWIVEEDGEPRFYEKGQLIDGGPLSCTIFVSNGQGRRSFGGPAARLAPHGRGPGWGQHGDSSLRRNLRNGFTDQDWTLAVQELANDASIAVLGIPDHCDLGEEARELRLGALRSAHVRRAMLAWSSVLIALDEIELHGLPNKYRIGVVEIDSEGLRIQLLTIQEREGVSAPERRQTGSHYPSVLGFLTREELFRRGITHAFNFAPLSEALEYADLPGLLALSGPGTKLSELVRQSNGDWREIAWTTGELDPTSIESIELPNCDKFILHSPAEKSFNQAVAEQIRSQSGKPVRLARPEAIAAGGLIAARRLAADLPLWYDFLPAVDTIVERGGKPVSYPLVPEDDVVRAGRTWRIPEPVELIWQARRESIEIWLRKEDDARPRSAPAQVAKAPDTDQRVLLSLEQQPGQGKASLTIFSSDWCALESRPARVDWDAGYPDERSWDEILESLKGKPPSYPDRVVLPAHHELWYPERGPGLAQALRNFRRGDFTEVYKALSRQKQLYNDQPTHPDHKRKFYAIDSDGNWPNDVHQDDVNLLLEVIESAERDLLAGTNKDNHSLGVLSWSFCLCPDSVWPIVYKVLRSKGGKSAFRGWHIMYPQAMGRIAGSPEAFRATIKYLSGLSVPWKRNQQACASFLLTRNNKVFRELDKKTVEVWTQKTCTALREASADPSSEAYRYLPTLTGGLLRWRIVEPFAFMRGRDDLGDQLGAALDQMCSALEDSGPRDDALRKGYAGVRAYLDDKATRPDLLQDLFDLT